MVSLFSKTGEKSLSKIWVIIGVLLIGLSTYIIKRLIKNKK